MLERIAGHSTKLNVPALTKRYHELRAAIDRLEGLEVTDLIDELFPEGDHDVELLRETALAALEKAETASAVLDELLRTITQPEVPQSPDFVRVMSLHKSKGLTSPVVIVATATAHVIPTIRGTLPDGEKKEAYAEGRRLFYVALTRSKDELIISYPFELLMKDALSMGISPERVWKRGDELVARVLATPYLTELGSQQPTAIRGEDWLQVRTRQGSYPN
jgi:ATP-dependent DNA helicase UvrD/PcrA